MTLCWIRTGFTISTQIIVSNSIINRCTLRWDSNELRCATTRGIYRRLESPLFLSEHMVLTEDKGPSILSLSPSRPRRVGRGTSTTRTHTHRAAFYNSLMPPVTKIMLNSLCTCLGMLGLLVVRLALRRIKHLSINGATLLHTLRVLYYSFQRRRHFTLEWYYKFIDSWDRSLNISTGYKLEGLGSIPSPVRFFILQQFSDRTLCQPLLTGAGFLPRG
jgi:hypothetical protein